LPAVVTVDAAPGQEVGRIVNHLFRSDFFGEKALLYDQPRDATVTASGNAPLVCLCLNRKVFQDLLARPPHTTPSTFQLDLRYLFCHRVCHRFCHRFDNETTQLTPDSSHKKCLG